jgi:predicted nuclease of restriction endonuclease-like (RecB) superfamily
MKKPLTADKADMTLYSDLLADIKMRIRRAQNRAVMSANAEMIRMYWDIGHMVAKRQGLEGWGKGLLRRLAVDLKDELPEIKGFSERNLQLMIQFQREYPDLFKISQRLVAELPDTSLPGKIQLQPGTEFDPNDSAQSAQGSEETQIVQRVVAQLPWAHNVILIQKLKDLPTRFWYARQAIVQGWSRDTLAVMIKSNAHKRQGAAVTNFDMRLPEPHAKLARDTLKDPYIFDFLALDKPFRERELEAGLVKHLERFLLELGAGFAFVGRQVHLDVAEEDFYIDLLFYHLKLRSFVVVDLKIGPFKPEYAGKINFYCNVVDDKYRHATDNPTIGLILCQDKKRVLAEYALRGLDKPIGISEYELTRALPDNLKSALPTIEEIEAELTAGLQDENEGDDKD